LPQEAELLKEIAALIAEADGEKELGRRERLLKQVESKRLEFNLMMERQKRMSRL
jgi:hypothetical protein